MEEIKIRKGKTMAEEIKRMDLDEFRDKGFLQEVNRLFFHPLGLALEVIIDDETGKVSHLGGVWDYRDDPEGMFFGKDTISTDKIMSVEFLRQLKRLPRMQNEHGITVDEYGIQLPE